MKIGSTPDIPTPATQAAQAKPATGGAAAVATAKAAAGTEPADKVTVSSLARTLEAAEADGVDMAKVSAVKTAIAQGTYKINAEAIADRLLANAREMLKPRVG